jgi:CRISPR/Cas system-associated exonuclease Cas4 (RecB family)
LNETGLLSKSTFLRGVQCQKSLALDAFHPELRDPLPATVRFRMRLGTEVGVQARKRYPGGEVGRVPGSYELSLARTADLIRGGAPVIYEAAFEAAGVRVVADVLVHGESGWRLIEVKSTTGAKPEHAWDVAVQACVLRQTGLELEEAALLHLNRGYVRQGELDYQALFSETSLLKEANELQREVERWIAECQATLASGEVPEVPIGPQCHDPVDCDFIGYCWKNVPTPSVFDVSYIGKKAYDLYDQGIVRIEDIPADQALDKRSAFHVEAEKLGETIVKPDELRAFLLDLHYPLYYLDFETFALPVPPYDGLSPYHNVPFQYSLYVQAEPGRPLRHHGYLAEAGIDPRREFLEQLLEDTAGDGDIIVYHRPFERGVLTALAGAFPDRAEAIESRIGRLVDLLDPFRKRQYWHPKMGGSNSLKHVLPVFAPELSYEALEVENGEQAMDAFLRLADEGDPERVEALRHSLWEYCKLDTLAMVRILDGLRAAVGL